MVILQLRNKHHYQIMRKVAHFLGHPILNQLLNYFNKQKKLQISREMDGERYVKTLNAWCHLTVMLYAVIIHITDDDFILRRSGERAESKEG